MTQNMTQLKCTKQEDTWREKVKGDLAPPVNLKSGSERQTLLKANYGADTAKIHSITSAENVNSQKGKPGKCKKKNKKT